MDAMILDQSFRAAAVLDTFESLIWTDRFRGYGDFEVCLPVEQAPPELLTRGNYLTTRRSDRMMVIEDISLETDGENGNRATVSGRSLESLLERRIIWEPAALSGNLQNGIGTLLTDNAIYPKDRDRAIPGLVFKVCSDEAISALTVDAQFLGDNLYDAIFALCEECDVGFRVLPTGENGLLFELYAGTDRSYQAENTTPVVFSPSFENLASSNYFSSDRGYRNVALVAGERSDSARCFVPVMGGSGASGLNRRELFVDAGRTWSDEPSAGQQYATRLELLGRLELARNAVAEAFEGEADIARQFQYRRDFFIGDIVQLENEFGMRARTRLTEMVLSQDASGETAVPTFSALTGA